MVEYRKLLVFSLTSVLCSALLFSFIYHVPVVPVIEEYKHATLPRSDPVVISPRNDPVAILPRSDPVAILPRSDPIGILPRSDPAATLPINDPVVTLRDPVDPELHSRKPCTMSSIQTYITQNDFFPDKGAWKMSGFQRRSSFSAQGLFRL